MSLFRRQYKKYGTDREAEDTVDLNAEDHVVCGFLPAEKPPVTLYMYYLCSVLIWHTPVIVITLLIMFSLQG